MNAKAAMRSAAAVAENNRNWRMLRKSEPFVARLPKKARISVVMPKSAIAQKIE